MTSTIIQVENLSKRYRIGTRENGYKTFREAIIDGFTAPIRNFKRLRKLSHFDDAPLPDNKELITNNQKPTPDNRQHITDNSSQSDVIWALKDVSFEVKQGEVLGIIGSNGSGKSTLLKILSRITEPTSGEVKLHGRVSSLLEVGTGFHPELTGRENIYLNGAILGMRRKEIENKFDEIVDFAEIEKFIDTPVKRYSSGMYVRLAFAVAAHLEPEILLVDEVLAVGDLAFQKKCLGKMEHVAEGGRIVLFVSHNMASIKSLCSAGILLEDGTIKSLGKINQVIEQYLSNGVEESSHVINLPEGNVIAPGRATRLSFYGEDNTPKTKFYIGEIWQITLEFEICRKVSHAIAAVGIITHDGVPLITYWSMASDLVPGNYKVSFECNIPLCSTNLQFAVGLSSYERTFYYANGVGRISISEIAKSKQPFRPKGTSLLCEGNRRSKIEHL